MNPAHNRRYRQVESELRSSHPTLSSKLSWPTRVNYVRRRVSAWQFRGGIVHNRLPSHKSWRMIAASSLFRPRSPRPLHLRIRIPRGVSNLWQVRNRPWGISWRACGLPGCNDCRPVLTCGTLSHLVYGDESVVPRWIKITSRLPSLIRCSNLHALYTCRDVKRNVCFGMETLMPWNIPFNYFLVLVVTRLHRTNCDSTMTKIS